MKREIKTVKNIFKTGPVVKTSMVVQQDPPLFPEATKDELEEMKYLKQQTEIAEMEEKRDALLKHELKKNPSKRKKELLKVLNASEGIVDDYSVNNVDNFIETPSDPSIEEALRDPNVYYKTIKVMDDKRTYHYHFPIAPHTIPNTGTIGYKLDNYDVYLDSNGAILVDKSNPNTLPMLLHQTSKGTISDPAFLIKLSKAGMYDVQKDVYDFAVKGKGFKVIKSGKENNVIDKPVESKNISYKGFFINPEDVELVDSVKEMVSETSTEIGVKNLYNMFMNGKFGIIGLPEDVKLSGKKFRISDVYSTSKNPIAGYVLLKRGSGNRVNLYITNTTTEFKDEKEYYGLIIPKKANKERILEIVEEMNKFVYKKYILDKE